jgi:AcrR family transcriptional regulator
VERKRESRRSSDGYHHGDLRRALLDAALALIEEKGIEALTLREVARRAGVSHAAPYHHFADLGALVSALAVEGLRGLGATQRAAAAGGRQESAAARVHALGLDYVRYAVRNPARFRLMWRPELCGSGDGEAVTAAGLEAYAPLLKAVAAGVINGEFAAEAVDGLAFAAWAEVHGIATLLVDGPIGRRLSGPDAAAELAGETIDRLLSGLLIR